MSAKEKNRLTMAEDDRISRDLDDLDRNANRLRGIAGERKPMVTIIITIVAVALVGGGLFYLYKTKKPHFFSKAAHENQLPSGNILEGDKKLLPESGSENIHLVRGKSSYFKGYYNDAISEFTEVAESGATDQEKAEALTYIGIIYDDRGEFDRAIEFYNRAIKYNRQNILTYRNLAIAYRHKNNLEAAFEAISQALSFAPDDTNNRILAGNILFQMGKFNEAANQYRAALRTTGDNDKLFYNLGITLYKQGITAEAIELFQKAAAISQTGEIAHLAYSKLGEIYSNVKDFSSAEKNLKLAVSLKPEDAVTHYNLAVVLLKQEKNSDALAEFTKAEAAGKQDVQLLEKLGEAYMAMQNYERSLAVFREILAVNQRNVRILSRVGELMYKQGDLEGAIEAFKRITELEPLSENARVAYINLGNALDEAQRFDEAIDAFKKSLMIDPKDSSVLYNLGIAYKHRGKPEMAIESWSRAADLNPDNPQPLIAVANFYYENLNFNEAEDAYVRIIRRWPDLPEPNFRLGGLYFQKNNLDSAAKAYQRCIDHDPKSDLARRSYINLSMIYSKKSGEENIIKADEMSQKALLLKPGDAESLFAYGVVLAKQGNHERAIDTYYQAIASTSDHKLTANIYNNIGKSFFSRRDYQKAMQAFTRGVEEDPLNEEIRLNRKTAMQAYEQELDR